MGYMYLPLEIPNARVLITVKTYPLPAHNYGELVCTAGLLNGEKWIRIHPISYRFMRDDQKYPKYSWIELDLIKNQSDYRPESYRPRRGIDEEIRVLDRIGTDNAWAARKDYILREIYTSMTEVISLAKGESCKSLATLKPKEIIDLTIEEDEREWKQTWLDKLKQSNMFELDINGQVKTRKIVKKIPYKFKYVFTSDGDIEPRELTIEDWEIGGLFWNCLRSTKGDEEQAKELVKKKYLNEFAKEKDIYFFLGTTYRYHKRSPNPFIIVGLFYPPKTPQLPLF